MIEINPPAAAADLAFENKVVIINANIIIDNPNSRIKTNKMMKLLLSKTMKCMIRVPIKLTMRTIAE